jgi:predicted CopG family antitoxin
MAKTIAIADDVYETLSKDKKEGESFSVVIRRLQRRPGSLMDCYGLWGDIPKEEFKEMEAAIYGADRPASAELKRRKVWR